MDEIEQYSDASREQLRQAALSLVGAVETHTVALLAMTGGTSVLDAVFELNSTVARAAAAWDDAVFDHTGVFPETLTRIYEATRIIPLWSQYGPNREVASVFRLVKALLWTRL